MAHGGPIVMLVQPRHVYAPPPSECAIGHVYMPTSLLAAASRLIQAGISVTVADENIYPASQLPDRVGVNIVGAPYIPEAIAFSRRLQAQHPHGVLLLGGQVVDGLGDAAFQQLFGPHALNGNDDRELCRALEIDIRSLPAPERTSLIPAYELLSDDAMALYLGAEFSLYVSQGCRYSCSFCAARHTRVVAGGRIVAAREEYRDMSAIAADLGYLARRALALGHREIRLYLSNLDLFQTPAKVVALARLLRATRGAVPEVALRVRALSNTNSFLSVHERDPSIISEMVDGGLFRVGFGIDGATPSVWKAIHKPHTSDSCLDAIRVAREFYGIVPEMLMVFGHNGADDADSLYRAREFVVAMKEAYGSLPRPHVAKDTVPGNDGWTDGSRASVVEYLLANPDAFQLLDFAALPSPLTHPDEGLRSLLTEVFVSVCGIEGAVTQYVMPQDPAVPDNVLREAVLFNRGRYDV